MDSRLGGFVDSINDFELNGQAFLTDSDQFPNFENGFKFDSHSPLDFNFLDPPVLPPDMNLGAFAPSSSLSPDGDSSDEGESSDSFLKYVSQMLMEENLEDKPCMFHDPLALQAAERSFYEVLGEQNPPSRNQTHQIVDSPDDNAWSSFSDYSSYSSPSNGSSNSVNQQWIADPGNSTNHQWVVDPGDRNYISSFLLNPLPENYVFGSTIGSGSQSSPNSSDSFSKTVNEAPSPVLVPNIFSDSESVLQFKRGVEEANKFLPKATNLVIDLENGTLPPQSKVETQRVVVKTEKDERENSPKWLRGRKNLHREDHELEEGRSRKQSAVHLEEDEDELSEMFDRVLLCSDPKAERSYYCTGEEDSHKGMSNSLQQSGHPQSNAEKTRTKKPSKEVVDLRTLLIHCAQVVSTYDLRTANELLKQIRQHSSPFGDGSQRLAHCFAEGLEARLAGTGTEIYTVLASKKVSAAAMLKAYELFLASCPYKKISVFFANHMILRYAEKATVLHIIDFGILYGFQWPILIQRLSARPGGPPKLRITGIELPQPGFRPAERVEETGRRLAKYCERFNVPFEYNAIAQKWETIQIEDLKVDSNEVIAVNCMFRFKNLLDETIVVDSPRNAVLGLIRKINPDIFIHSIINGSYNAPFFVTRFREALFHFSAVFDSLDNNIARENEHRLMYEKEFLGREVMNVIACEGSERVERPETYRQWQVRTQNAGFRLLPLNQELTKKLKTKVKVGSHKDFLVDEDGHWLLQGWKGRVLYASSCWTPA
ncbi:hypothetical protein PVL29_007502 [Vitis rotundifolia]|uniref:Scarecrow-like protein 14 n=1 Tax=Vitis rotundifolia TaxID=103349 RepID=A0AA39A0T1_VITRO|nr:hypothetical protein PVL29_007502 [Vitis rotundifolia]